MAVLTAMLHNDHAAPGEARRCLAAMLRTDHVEAEVMDTALLVVSELVTNAVLHGRSTVRVEAVTDHDLLHLEVTDDSSTAPRRRRANVESDGGWGLHLVDVLTTDWGFGPREDGHSGKVVWVDLPLVV